LGLPALALALVFLATRSELKDARRVPRWMIALGCAGILLTLLLAARTVGLLLPRLG
jgi:hypothetical protein